VRELLAKFRGMNRKPKKQANSSSLQRVSLLNSNIKKPDLRPIGSNAPPVKPLPLARLLCVYRDISILEVRRDNFETPYFMLYPHMTGKASPI
jgi:hypothetical protein